MRWYTVTICIGLGQIGTAQAQPIPSEDGWLMEAFAEAQSASREFKDFISMFEGGDASPAVMAKWDNMVAAWGEFKARVEICRQQGLSYTADTFDVYYDQVPYRIGWAGWEAMGAVEQVTSDEGFATYLDTAQSNFGEFLQGYGSGRLHPRITSREFDVAVSRRADLLVAEGQVLFDMGATGRAGDVWGQARDMIRATIDAIIDNGLEEDGYYDSESLGALTAQYLEAVRLANGDLAYVDAAEEAYSWLKHQPQHGTWRGDHRAINEMRRVAMEWTADHSDREYLDMAERLAGIVIRAEAEIWDGQWAHTINNVGAYLTLIKIALINGELARADELLAKLEAVDGIKPWRLEQIQKLRQLVNKELGLDPMSEILAMLDEDEPSAPARIATTNSPDSPGPGPVQVRPPSRSTTPPPAAARLNSTPESKARVQWWHAGVGAAVLIGALFAFLAVKRRTASAGA